MGLFYTSVVGDYKNCRKVIASERASQVCLLSPFFHLVHVETSLGPFCYLSPGLGSAES